MGKLAGFLGCHLDSQSPALCSEETTASHDHSALRKKQTQKHINCLIECVCVLTVTSNMGFGVDFHKHVYKMRNLGRFVSIVFVFVAHFARWLQNKLIYLLQFLL